MTPGDRPGRRRAAGRDRGVGAHDRRQQARARAAGRAGARGRAARPRGRRFATRLGRPGRVNIIAECKRRSPARGVLRGDYAPAAIARSYEAARRGGDLGADRAHVLRRRRSRTSRRSGPRRRSRCCARTSSSTTYQMLEARAAGADAILLIVAALDPASLRAARRVAPRHSAWPRWSRCTAPRNSPRRVGRRRATSSA